MQQAQRSLLVLFSDFSFIYLVILSSDKRFEFEPDDACKIISLQLPVFLQLQTNKLHIACQQRTANLLDVGLLQYPQPCLICPWKCSKLSWLSCCGLQILHLSTHTVNCIVYGFSCTSIYKFKLF